MFIHYIYFFISFFFLNNLKCKVEVTMGHACASFYVIHEKSTISTGKAVPVQNLP